MPRVGPPNAVSPQALGQPPRKNLPDSGAGLDMWRGPEGPNHRLVGRFRA